MAILQELLTLKESGDKFQALANQAGEMMWHNWMNGGSARLTEYQTTQVLAAALGMLASKSPTAAHAEFEKLAEAAMKAKGSK